jgi:multidrug efflux pump subunit AcrB
VSHLHGRARDEELVRTQHNTARYFAENRQVAWVLLVATLLAGAYSYLRMPKAKDPLVPVRVAVATCLWPGAPAEKIEDLVTRKIEEKVAESSKVEKIESLSRSSIAIVTITLSEDVVDRAKELDDIKGKLDAIHDLPSGAGPINFLKDFGDTAALMLTVASPKVNEVELSLRARAIARAITAARKGDAGRVTIVVNFPADINSRPLRRAATGLQRGLVDSGVARDPRLIEGPGFLGIDLATELDDASLVTAMLNIVRERMQLSELHPDVWRAAVVRDPKDTEARLATVVGDRYSYRELDDYTSTIQRYLQTVPLVTKVTRSGVLDERVFLDYSQERLAAYNLHASGLSDLLTARNITVPGGVVEIGAKNVSIDPSGELHNEREIGDILVTTTATGAPLYLRDLVEISRDYQSPPRFLNALTTRGPDGSFVRSRAITLAVQMRPGSQIADFGAQVDATLATVRQLLPEDLVVRRTSDQPLQVRESVDLFMTSLYEAIALVVVVAFLGFWEWRSALLLALTIPLTVAMTFAMMHVLGIDVQQISIASLILALGLLVDDPVVAGDAIKRSLADGWPRVVAAWLGPTKLARAILFATVTNIAAYLPLLAIGGDVGRFIYSLPVVLTCSLVASRIVSMTFIQLLGYVLLRPSGKPEPTLAERRGRGFARVYRAVVGWAIDHRRLVFAISLVLLIGAFAAARGLKTAFFPQDLSYLSYVDVWLPEDAPLSATRAKAEEAERVVRTVVDEVGHKRGEPELLESITTFVGGGAPRFWFSVTPELSQLNYAQLVIQVRDKHVTPELIAPLQAALARIPGARLDVRRLENGKPVGIPVAVRIAGEDKEELRATAERVKAVFRAVPSADRVRDDWGADAFTVKLEVDPDRANRAGVTNLDVALSSAVAMNGRTVSLLREGDKQIPIVSRLRAEERAQLVDIENLYVTAQRSTDRVPLRQVSRLAYSLETEKIRRRDQFRAITVACFPVPGVLPSEVIQAALPEIEKIAASVPPGYSVKVAGELEEQKKGFGQLAVVLFLSITAIFIALVLQFKSGVKPVVVFAAIPYGVAGALLALLIARAPFGFMAFLGIVSLIGVIVSHIIVLFDFIEEMHEAGEPLREALLDAGIMRLRPVLITVAATVLGLFPLAAHGGPLWEPLCYAQIGGLTVATFLTLLLVPVIYTIFVRDLGWIRWVEVAPPAPPPAPPAPPPAPAAPPVDEAPTDATVAS